MINHWVLGAAVFLATFSLFLVLKRVLFGRLVKLAKETATGLDDLLLRSLSLPLNLLFVLVAILVAQTFVELPPRHLPYVQSILKTLLIVGGIFFVDRFFVGLVSMKQRRTTSNVMISASSWIKGATHVVVFGLGGLIIMDSMGVSITPLIASLGIGSLALALALQDTLTNVLSGIYLLVDRPLELGHYVKLDSGDEGFVEKIGWRTTRIRSIQNNYTVLPNSKIAGSHLTNFSKPDPEMSVLMPVGVSYASDLQHVEKVTLEVAREVLGKIEGGVTTFDPFLRYNAFGDSSINFNVVLRVHKHIDQYPIKHEFIKALHERYNQEGINIPFPIRTLELPDNLQVSVQDTTRSTG